MSIVIWITVRLTFYMVELFGICGGLIWHLSQVPIKAPVSLPSSAGQGRENTMEG